MRSYLNSFRIFFSVLVVSGFLYSGCAVVLVGAGAAGGLAISQDEVEGYTTVSFEKVWTVASEILRKEGALTLQQKETGIIKADIDDSDVKVTLEQVTVSSVRIVVQARKLVGLFPDMKRAQSIYRQILKKIE